MKNFDIKRLTPIIYVLSLLILLLIIFKVFIFLLPFVIATVIVKIINPIIKKIVHKNRMLSSIILGIFYLIILLVVFLIMFKISLEIYNLFMNIITNKEYILAYVLKNIKQYEKYIEKLPEYSSNFLNPLVEKIMTYINNSAIGILNSSLNLLKSLPSLIVFIVVTILSSFIILNDKKNIVNFIVHQFPESWLKVGVKIKEDVLKLFLNYVKAQCILISLCFVESFIGLSIISIYSKNLHYVLLFSVVIAFVDALPILGAGSAIMPMVLVEIFIFEDYILALSLFILYIIIFLIRQYTEPKLISKGSGMHPLLTLIAMYAGFKIFGILGFLYGPIIAAIIHIVFADEIKYGFFKYLIKSKGKKDE